MRRILFSLVFIAFSMIAKAQFVVYEPIEYPSYSSSIPRSSYSTPIVPRSSAPFVTYTPTETVVTGKTYNATVYYESSTGHLNTYRLRVVVNDGAVKKIIFNDNGGCVHVGINNSGYKYYGGELVYIEEIDALATEVDIVYPNSWHKYTIIIE